MKNLFRPTFFFAIVASCLITSCDKKGNTVPKVKEKPQFVFENHLNKEVFNACKWVWGNYYELPKLNYSRQEIFVLSSGKDVLSRKALIPKQNNIIDSIVFIYKVDGLDNRRKTFDSVSIFSKAGIQILDINENGFEGIYDWGNDFGFGHYNSDNYLDFNYLNYTSGNQGRLLNIYCYDPILKMFVRNKLLSDCTSLRYNKEKNIYQYWSRGSRCDFIAERFVLKNGNKKVLKAIHVEPVNLPNGRFLERKLIIGNDTLIKYYRYYAENYCIWRLDSQVRQVRR